MSTLKYTQLSIHSAPGFEQGGFSLKKLDSRINIIYGPNAAGKTTAARAMQLLLWPQAEGRNSYNRRTHVDAKLDIDGSGWFAEYERGRVSYQLSGSEASRPEAFLAPEVQPRYNLALHELLQADNENEDFAELIRRESVGGFDIDAAAEEAGADSSIKPKSISEYKRFERAKKRLRELRAHEGELQEQERELGELRRTEGEEREAGRLRDLYARLETYKKHSRRIEELEAEISDYPGTLERFTENDAGQARESEQRISELKSELEAEDRVIGELSSELAELSFDPPEDFETRLDVWQEKVEGLKQRLNERRQYDSRVSEAESKVEERYRDLGRALESADWQGLKAADLTQVKELSRRAEDLRAASKAVGEQLKRLPEREPAYDDDTMKRALRSLVDLLAGFHRGYSVRLTLAAVLALVAGLATVLFHPPAGLVLGAAGGICFLIAFVQVQARPSLKKLIERYEQLGLKEFIPENWDEESALTTLEALALRLGDETYLREIQRRRDELEKDREEEEKKQQEYRRSWNRLRGELGALPDFLDEEYGLSWLIDEAARLSRALEDKSAAEAGRRRKDEEIRRTLSELQEQWSPWAGPQQEVIELEDVETATALLKQLNERYARYRELTSKLGQARERKEEKERRSKQEREKLRKLYSRLGIEEEEAPLELLRQWEEQLPRYRELSRDLRDCGRDREAVLRELRDSESFREEMLEEKLDAIESLREEYTEQAEKLEQTLGRITEIETNLKNEKGRGEIEAALAEYDAAAQQLASRRDRNFEALVVDSLVKNLKERVRHRDRPKVFREAGRLFERLTLGLFSLELDDSADLERPSFRAVDNARGKSLLLDQLSSGTRIQLLLAVRVAFLSRGEQGMKLPLFVDEVLANSDDERARLIIKTLIRIAEEGRQVFYFTAQGDEVARWRQVLEEDEGNVDYRITPLRSTSERPLATEPRRGEGGADGEGGGGEDGDVIFSFSSFVAKPQGLSHAEYGEALEVPRYEPLTEPVESMHIWYVIEEPELIYRAAERSIDRVGQLQTYVESEGVVDGLPENFSAVLHEKVELLREAVRLYRIGRSVPVPIHAVEESGAVTERFMKQVREIHREVGGVPERLLARVAEIPKFQRNKLEQLEEYLQDEGYLSTREPYAPEELRARLQARISNLRQLDRNEAAAMLERVFS